MYGTGVDCPGGAGGACDGIGTISDGLETSEIDELASTAGDKGNDEASCEAALISAASITDTGAGAAAGGAGAGGIGGGGDELGTGEEEPRRGGGGFVSGSIPTAGRAAAGVSDKISGT